jgi:DNA-binding CsgD family transcriptional regulator
MILNNISTVTEALAEVDLSILVAGLTNEPHTGISVVRLSGEVLYTNDHAVRIFLGEDADPVEARAQSLWGVLPEAWVRECVGFGSQVMESGEPAMIRTVWKGRQVLSWVSPLDEDASPAEARLLIVSRFSTESPAGEENGTPRFTVFESKHISLGDLGVLSPRELEVLSLVGQGLSIKEIAAMLHRSEKTIQNHRDSIGSKLGLANRVHVAAVARRAGLTPRDASKTRI